MRWRGSVERGWCWSGAGDGGAARAAGGERATVRKAGAGVMRAHVALFVAWCCAVLATGAAAAAGELRVLRADARAVFFVGIAAPPSAAAAVRAFNRSLADISRTHFAGDYPLYLRNITLQPLYIELPEDER
ncbi:unnamed protein product, partial [Iphiclides podalirius]